MTIYPRGKKRIYVADFHYCGQHRRQSLRTANRKLATERAVALEAELQQGTFGQRPQQPLVVSAPSSPHLLDEAREAYIKDKIADGTQPKTWKKYDGTLREFNSFCAENGRKHLDQVTLGVIDGYKQKRAITKVRGKTLSKTQQYHDLSLLKRFFAWCRERNMLTDDPLAKQRFSRPPLRRHKSPPTLAQVDTILAALPARIQAPVAVLALTGMRSANCRHLLGEDVDLRGGWIHVRSREGARTKVGNEWSVPIHPRLAAVLKMLPPATGRYLFTAPPSRMYPAGDHWINIKHINDDFVEIVKKLGLPAGRETGFTIHSLRHFFKSFCLSHNVPRNYVDAWQGHRSIKTASDLYVHPFDDESLRLMSQVPFGDGKPAADAGESLEQA